MWINTMLTILLWGLIFSLVVVGFSLWKWYFSEPPVTTDGASKRTSSDEGDPER